MPLGLLAIRSVPYASGRVCYNNMLRVHKCVATPSFLRVFGETVRKKELLCMSKTRFELECAYDGAQKGVADVPSESFPPQKRMRNFMDFSVMGAYAQQGISCMSGGERSLTKCCKQGFGEKNCV